MTSTSEEAMEIVDREIGSLEVDARGKCQWTEVANALTHIKAQLRLLSPQSGEAVAPFPCPECDNSECVHHGCARVDPLAIPAEALAQITDEQRLALFHRYCVHCGADDAGCGECFAVTGKQSLGLGFLILGSAKLGGLTAHYGVGGAPDFDSLIAGLLVGVGLGLLALGARK